MLRRYCIVKIASDLTVYVETEHIFLSAAIAQLERRQNEEGELGLRWGNQLGLWDRRRGVILPVKLMLQRGAMIVYRKEKEVEHDEG